MFASENIKSSQRNSFKTLPKVKVIFMDSRIEVMQFVKLRSGVRVGIPHCLPEFLYKEASEFIS